MKVNEEAAEGKCNQMKVEKKRSSCFGRFAEIQRKGWQAGKSKYILRLFGN